MQQDVTPCIVGDLHQRDWNRVSTEYKSETLATEPDGPDMTGITNLGPRQACLQRVQSGTK